MTVSPSLRGKPTYRLHHFVLFQFFLIPFSTNKGSSSNEIKLLARQENLNIQIACLKASYMVKFYRLNAHCQPVRSKI